jgi:nicotinamidase-related amidase
LRNAAGVIITIHTQALIDDVVEHVRAMRPDILIVARARDAEHARHLYALGATDAVPETIEASLQLSEAALVGLGVPPGRRSPRFTKSATRFATLSIPQAELIIRKGFHNDVDSYSAFMEADKKTHTGLGAYLKERGIDTVYVTGLATDFCVAWTAIDARQAGLTVYVVEDACRGIDVGGSLAKAWADMTAAGVKKIQSSDLAV